jgi:DNA invertase Pin-like site-specific DNA recombinase
MLIGYMRASKADGSQALDMQRDALLAAGIQTEHIYEDLASGSLDARPGLTACLKALREEDTLVVWKLDRLGRNLRHLVNTVHDLTSKGVGFKVLTGQGASINTTTPEGKLVLAFLPRWRNLNENWFRSVPKLAWRQLVRVGEMVVASTR